MSYDISQWTTIHAQQDRGFFMWVVLVAMALMYILWFIRNSEQTSHKRMWVRIAASVAVLVWLVLIDLQWIATTLLALYVGYTLLWRTIKNNYLLAFVLLGLALRLGLFHEALWYDEIFTAMIAQQPFNKLMPVILADVHPPLWYLIEWGLVQLFGDSEIVLRTPALLASLALIPATYYLARLVTTERAALAAAFIVTVLPAQVYYGSEARAYSLLALCVVAMTIAVIERRAYLFIIAACASVLLHNLGYIHVLVLGLIGLWLYRHKWTIAIVVPASVGFVWLPYLLQQTNDISDGFWLPFSLYGSIEVFTETTIGWHVSPHWLLFVTASLTGLIIMAFISCWGWLSSKRALPLLAMMLFTPALLALISSFWQPVYLTRAMLSTGIGLAILFGYTLTETFHANRLVYRFWIIPALLVAVCSLYIPANSSRANIDREIAASCRGSDVIFNTSVHTHIITQYYSPLPSVLWINANDTNQTLTPQAKQALGWEQGNIEDLTGRVCVLDFDTMLSSPHERDYTESIVENAERKNLVEQNSLFTLSAHIVRIP